MPLSDDDKAWLRGELSGIRDEFRVDLKGIREEQISLRSDLKGIHEEQISIRLELTKMRDEIERVETRLLTEFHKWASPAEARLRSHTAALRALDLEHEAISTQ
jgi:hypothetical protein